MSHIPDNFIYTYSFGIRPEEQQPSGIVNMSRIDNAQLRFDLTNVSNLPLSPISELTLSPAPEYSEYKKPKIESEFDCSDSNCSECEFDCPICLNDTTIGVVILTCDHKICLNCTHKLHKQGTIKCPLCRKFQENYSEIRVIFSNKTQKFSEIIYTQSESLQSPQGPAGQWNGAVGRIAIYATNYNVFRVMSGMGGLAYSN